ncbi:hypothetical protein VP01_1296g3 [Puccinia sorghi]|uniref:Uncharacterized protein n=1 Tax=Puccinia sorghi TaxID=27349 RepID=A0A0L6VN89_9BASI|nr:hypothetical protein VP01_1296g3 [Puccinia sorghi]
MRCGLNQLNIKVEGRARIVEQSTFLTRGSIPRNQPKGTTTTASAVVWLQSIPALLSLLTPVLASHPNNLITRLAYRQLGGSVAVKPAPVPQISIWSHYNTISGFTFFDSFTFINRWDNTSHSAAYYVDQQEAQRLSLAYVDDHARAIIAVDTTKDLSADVMPAVFLNTTTGTFRYNQTALRSSVRLESLERYDPGTLIIADFHHTPYGVSSFCPDLSVTCASWPACKCFFFIFSNSNTSAEIAQRITWVLVRQSGSFFVFPDRFLKAGMITLMGERPFTHNLGKHNAHHSTRMTVDSIFLSCSHDPSGIQTGKVLQETCNSKVNYNAGCSVEDPTTDFYGPTLNSNGGAVSICHNVHQFGNFSLEMVRLRRQDVPVDIKSNSPRPELWPVPVATWKSGASCDIPHKFGPQNLVINIAMCGDSDLNTYSQGKCPGKCYDYLLKGSHYKDVYFAINSIKIFKGLPDAVSKPVAPTTAPPKPATPLTEPPKPVNPVLGPKPADVSAVLPTGTSLVPSKPPPKP